MNSFIVSYSKQSEADLDSIYSFIADEYKNTKAALKLLRRLTKAVEDLSFMADSYHFYQIEPYLSQGVRYFSEGKYSVFYKIRGKEVFVIRIVNGAMDIPKVLAGYT